MDIYQLHQIAKKEIEPHVSDIPALRNLVNEYPYFQVAIFAYLKAIYLHDPENFNEELIKSSIKVCDRRALFYYILSEEFDQFFLQTGKKEIEEDKTNVLLNAFFESRDENNREDELEFNISHSSLASTDYFTYLQIENKEDSPEQSEKRPLKHQNIIDSFINKAEHNGGIRITPGKTDNDNIKQSENTANDNEDELSDDIFFTETLAKIYIKQKKYEKAYKIIKHLSLNYPKKNIYFADQLNFLEKLIINTKYKDTK